MERFGAVLAADPLELAGCSRRSRATLDVSHVLLEPTLREMPSTMGAYRILGALSRCHLYFLGPAVSPSREGIGVHVRVRRHRLEEARTLSKG